MERHQIRNLGTLWLQPTRRVANKKSFSCFPVVASINESNTEQRNRKCFDFFWRRRWVEVCFVNHFFHSFFQPRQQRTYKLSRKGGVQKKKKDRSYLANFFPFSHRVNMLRVNFSRRLQISFTFIARTWRYLSSCFSVRCGCALENYVNLYSAFGVMRPKITRRRVEL